MASFSHTYEVSSFETIVGLRFLFVSNGQRRILKDVQYTYVQQYEDREVYNLGFGDYDATSGEVLDEAKSNNGDAYLTFRTVLSTIPMFFSQFPEAIIMVRGSDSRPDFIERCRLTCTKQCDESCKRFRQRITLYRAYVEKNFFDLSPTYWFLGGFVLEDETMNIELYIPGREYDAILFFEK